MTGCERAAHEPHGLRRTLNAWQPLDRAFVEEGLVCSVAGEALHRLTCRLRIDADRLVGPHRRRSVCQLRGTNRVLVDILGRMPDTRTGRRYGSRPSWRVATPRTSRLGYREWGTAGSPCLLAGRTRPRRWRHSPGMRSSRMSGRRGLAPSSPGPRVPRGTRVRRLRRSWRRMWTWPSLRSNSNRSWMPPTGRSRRRTRIGICSMRRVRPRPSSSAPEFEPRAGSYPLRGYAESPGASAANVRTT
jgi:hypothetical protein